MSVKAILALRDGSVLEGVSIGAAGTTVGQVVFNTSMTGYQEMLSDPSYGGQILTFTYPLIGNYGVTPEDFESDRVQVRGVVLKELCSVPSNWRSEETLASFLKRHGVPGIAGIDTRSLTRKLRIGGVMLGGVSTELSASELVAHVIASPDYDSIDYVAEVSTQRPWIWSEAEGRRAPKTAGGCPLPPSRDEPGGGPLSSALDGLSGTHAPGSPDSNFHGYPRRVAVLDLGVKRNILRRLADLGCEPHVFPATSSAEELLAIDPAGVLVSPGPGDPERLGYALATVKGLIGKRPMLGICLGHQLLAHAFGAKTFPLKFGHRGGNHPVKDLISGAVTITSQNHGYAVDPAGLAGTGLEVSRTNLNDGTVEGLRHQDLPLFSLQYHPEASPGPWDSDPLFSEFIGTL